MRDTSRSNNHQAVIGASGSGKSTYIRQELRRLKPARLLIWDPDEDHTAHHIHDLRRYTREVAKAIRSGKGFRLALTVPPTREAFEHWAQTVWLCGGNPSRPVLAVAEEIADVTTASKAPPWWGTLLRRGRKYAVDVIATTQRIAEADKTFITQSGTKWCGGLEPHDAKVAARYMGVTEADLQALGPLEYYRRENRNPPERGKLKLPSK